MKLTTSIVLFLSLLCAPFAAATGESCYYWDSEKWGVSHSPSHAPSPLYQPSSRSKFWVIEKIQLMVNPRT